MTKLIGPADEFYRLRVSRLDLSGEVEFDWRDDILWRTTPGVEPSEEDAWFMEAVTLDGREVVTRIAAFASADEARRVLDEVSADLTSMSKSEFEVTYLNALADKD